MMSVESDRAIAMAVNPVSGESNSRRQSSEPRGEHHVGPPAQGALLWALHRGNGPRRGTLRHRTGDVLADRVDDADGMMGVRHPLTSTGAVRICTGKTE
jgi:hypothetical protein